MIIFLYGQDSYRAKEKLSEIVGHYKTSGKSGLSLVNIDAEKSDFSDFYNTFKISSMFGEKKLIILKNLFINKLFQENFLDAIEDLEKLKDIIVIFETSSVDERLKFFKILTKGCKSQEFKLLDGKLLKDWILKEFEVHKAKINLDALDLLLRFVGNDPWRLSGEIKKLVNFKNGLVVKKEDIMLLVKPNSMEADIFKTIDALALKNKKQALNFLHAHLDNGDNPLYILSMIGYQFRNLVTVKELAQKGMLYASIVKKSGLHPFVVKKTYFACHQFSLEELKKMYWKIFQMDSDIKMGKIDAEAALDLLVLQV